MHRYILSKTHQQSVERILIDSHIDLTTMHPSDLSGDFNFDFHDDDLWEYADILETLLDSENNYPLFANIDTKSNVLAQTQNYIVLKSFIEEARKEAESFEDTLLCSGEHDDIRLIKNGEYVMRLLKQNFLDLDFSQYGFNDAFEMAYLIGAYLSNWAKYDDPRIVIIDKGDIVYSYENHSHGDFRLSQYNCQSTRYLDPLGSNTVFPFGKPQFLGRIAGYHSIETYFLTDLLGMLYFNKASSEIIDCFPHFIEKLKIKGQSLGNYGDAGMYSTIAVTMGFMKYQYNQLEYICTDPDDNGFYEPIVESNKLVIYRRSDIDERSDKITMSIPLEHINDLIVGLFHKVAKGNGRSSIYALEDTMNYYRAKYCGINKASLTFNKNFENLDF